ncbi:uncharacterized protein [Pseudochaenichthys georgianus]|uniref:uncharacterized protein n=1 Tax=Pseudochaenichthys georgianus TaxID=52239 RepID=UPI00146F6F4A|nr:uncharacterized protein LOC117443914 isoform X1 [Pseudochaenichthys georgianus]
MRARDKCVHRWKADRQVNAEFMRITTFPLETKFLDKHSTKLLQVIRSRGGVVKQKTTGILQVLDETVDITIRRECILKSLMIYLGEPVDHLFKEFQEAEAGELEQATMAIFVIGKEDQFHRPKDVKVLIEGTEVLSGLPSVATAFAMLFGLIYALNLKYPKELQSTFEVVQKVLMELEGKKMSPKVNSWVLSLFTFGLIFLSCTHSLAVTIVLMVRFSKTKVLYN